MSRIHLTEEEVYDILRDIFHNEEDALAATIQLFRGDPITWDEDYVCFILPKYSPQLDSNDTRAQNLTTLLFYVSHSPSINHRIFGKQ
jgi:hypothetical protein